MSGGRGRLGRLWPRGPGVEREEQIANLDAIVFFQPVHLMHLLAVDEGAVAALQILHEVIRADMQNLGVLATDGAHVQDDIAIRVAAKNGLFAVELELLTGGGSLENLQ